MKKEYTTEEALNEVFNAASPSGLGKSEYDKLINYKLRFQRGELGRRAIDNLLSKNGFTKQETIIYTKERNTTDGE